MQRNLPTTPAPELDFVSYPETHGGSRTYNLTPESIPESRLESALAVLATVNLFEEN